MVIDPLPGYLQFLVLLACFSILGEFFAWRHKRARISVIVATAFAAAFGFVMEFGVLSAISEAINPTTGNGDIALPCENAIINTNSSGTFYRCPHPTEVSNIVFDLPPPMYKKMRCFGCGVTFGYTEVVPPDLLSLQQKQDVIDRVMDLPETKLNSGWTLDRFDIHAREDKWIAYVQLFLAGIKQLSPSQECGWYGSAEVDLETLEILGVVHIPPESDVKC